MYRILPYAVPPAAIPGITVPLVSTGSAGTTPMTEPPSQVSTASHSFISRSFAQLATERGFYTCHEGICSYRPDRIDLTVEQRDVLRRIVSDQSVLLPEMQLLYSALHSLSTANSEDWRKVSNDEETLWAGEWRVNAQAAANEIFLALYADRSG